MKHTSSSGSLMEGVKHISDTTIKFCFAKSVSHFLLNVDLGFVASVLSASAFSSLKAMHQTEFGGQVYVGTFIH